MVWVGRRGGWVCSGTPQGVVTIHSLIQPVSVPCPPLCWSHSAKHTTFMRDTQPKGTHLPEKSLRTHLTSLQEILKFRLSDLTPEKSDSIGLANSGFSGCSVSCYGKTWINFLASPIHHWCFQQDFQVDLQRWV